MSTNLLRIADADVNTKPSSHKSHMMKHRYSYNITKIIDDYTQLGKSIADECIVLVEKTMRTATNDIQRSIATLKKKQVADRDVTRQLTAQLNSFVSKYQTLPYELRRATQELPDGTFTISMFGRTEAGKSTLLTILTGDDGSLIGDGSQRTTLAVTERFIKEKRLKYYDVPGIDAASDEGTTDEEAAFECAKKSDLIVFLVADSIQREEAEYFARLKTLGKPLILLFNINIGIDDKDDGLVDDFALKVFRMSINRKYRDREWKSGFRDTFLEYGRDNGQDWARIPYAFVHLKAAFLSQLDVNEDHRDALHELSHFDDADRLIMNEVIKHGGYYRLKNYANVIVNPLIETLEDLFAHSADNSRLGKRLVRKRKTFNRWVVEYEKRSAASIDAFINMVTDELKKEAEVFAEDNFSNRDASSAWERLLRNKHLKDRADKLVESLEKECNDELVRLGNEIDIETSEFRYASSSARVKSRAVIDTKKLWDIATLLAYGGLTIAGLFFAPELTILGTVFGVISAFGSDLFDDYDHKRRQAQKEMCLQLYDDIEARSERLRKSLHDYLKQELVDKKLWRMSTKIRLTIGTMFDLSSVQRSLATDINERLEQFNMSLVSQALAYSGHTDVEADLVGIARIPGNVTVLFLRDGAHLPPELRPDLGRLLSETIRYVFESKDKKALIARIMGHTCRRSDISIEPVTIGNPIVHIRGYFDLDANALVNVRLAEQASSLLIME